MISLCYAAATTALMLGSTVCASEEPSNNNLFFYEKFDDDVLSSGKWVRSKSPKYSDQKVLIQPSKSAAEGFENDKGLHLLEEMRHYGVGTMFPEPFTFSEGKDLVIQYDVKLEEGLSCGGAYLKFIRKGEDGQPFSMESLDNVTPYTIMFGPDHCGAANDKVHFILQHKNTHTSQYGERHFNDTPAVFLDKKTHLYTLVVKASDDVPRGTTGSGSKVEYYLDMKLAKDGHLLTHMNPPINPATMIDDPNDVKPADWVDEIQIPDPDEKKPDDWDEDAPRRIPDPEAVAQGKPAEWDESNPELIPDPEISKPTDWDDEEDGEWEPPMIRNPVCDTPAGCGKWVVPMVNNPAYKGKWRAPMIPNPAYRGVWRPRQIPNPDTSYDPNPLTHLSPIIGVAVEVWTTVGSIHIDNIVVATNLVDAFKFAEQTFVAKNNVELIAEQAEVKAAKAKQREDALSKGGWKDQIQVYLGDVADMFLDASPLQMAGIVGATLTLIAMSTFYLLGIGEPAKSTKSNSDGDGDDDTDPAADAVPSTLASAAKADD